MSPDDSIIDTLASLGTNDTVGELHVKDIEKCICKVYCKDTSITSVKDLRWEMFRLRNCEGEKLPPTLAALRPHIMRANFISMRDKSYTDPLLNLPPLVSNGWEIIAGSEHPVPVFCLEKTAPIAVLEMIRCACAKKKCATQACSCRNNKMPCSDYCKCK